MFYVCILALCSLFAGVRASDSSPNGILDQDTLVAKQKAITKVFLDSTIEALPADVHFVKSHLPAFAQSFDHFLPHLQMCYRLRCLQLSSAPSIEFGTVCTGCSMSTDADLSLFVNGVTLEQAARFFMLPPGNLRSAVRTRLLQLRPDDYLDALVDAIKYGILRYMDNIEDVSNLFTVEMIQKSSPFVPDLSRYDLIYLAQQFQNLTPQDRFLCNMMPSDLTTFGIVDKLILELVKLCFPLPNYSNQSILQTLESTIWTMTRQLYIPAGVATRIGQTAHRIRTLQDFYAYFVHVVSLHNPRPFLENLQEYPKICSVFELSVAPFLSEIESRTLDGDHSFIVDIHQNGKWNRVKQYIELVGKKTVIDAIMVKWTRSSLEAVLSTAPQIKQSLQTGSADSNSSNVLQITPPDTACNPKAFFELITERIPRNSLFAILALYRLGFHLPMPAEDEILVNQLLEMVLSAAEKEAVALLAYQRSRSLLDRLVDHAFRTEFKWKRDYAILSLVFRIGQFSDPSGSNSLFRGMEALARLFHPKTVNGARCARHLRNVEDLVMCPLIDLGWVLEEYGTLDGDLNSPQCLGRLSTSPHQTLITGKLRARFDRFFAVPLNFTEYAQSARLRLVNFFINSIVNNQHGFACMMVSSFKLTFFDFTQIMNLESIDDKVAFLCDYLTINHPKYKSAPKPIIIEQQLTFEDKLKLIDFYPPQVMADTIFNVLCSNISDDTVNYILNRLYYFDAVVERLVKMLWTRAIANHDARLARIAFYTLVNIAYQDVKVALVNHAVAQVNDLDTLKFIFPFHNVINQQFDSLCTNPKVDFRFKMFLMSVSISFKNFDAVRFCCAALYAHAITRVRGRKEDCCRFVIDTFDANYGISLNVDMINESLGAYPLLAVDYTNSVSSPFSRIVRENDDYQGVFLDNFILVLPSKADASHLYALMQLRIHSTSAFTLFKRINAPTVQQVIDPNEPISSLTNVPLSFNPKTPYNQ